MNCDVVSARNAWHYGQKVVGESNIQRSTASARHTSYAHLLRAEQSVVQQIRVTLLEQVLVVEEHEYRDGLTGHFHTIVGACVCEESPNLCCSL